MARHLENLAVRPNQTLRFQLNGERRWREARMRGFISRFAVLAPLDSPALFSQAEIIDGGLAVGWPNDLDVYVDTLVRLSEEQSAFSNADFRAWQQRCSLSIRETASVLDLAESTVKNYRGDAPIPSSIAVTCRAMERDPAILAAHLVPRKPGRPRKAEA